ncbi:hypothetical protein Pla22_01040 [Rubripirellula amarantea]|uniref:Uncharacterized protein n=1 Tax=Rubripirellula amarantea TaxID=2527999 RepID=A0A5C5WPX2_9BACT|nr:tetratricopeptide repeat protein [Rubripirellula amarantea]TWT52480.1 hypothetical protein Pla22_01040 [Rubripirellula amarantea]
MNRPFPIALFGSFVVFAIGFSGVASGQQDRLYDTSGKNIAGTVTQISAKGVQIKKGSNAQNFMASDVEKILFDGDPSGLTKGREFALDGQYEQALEQLKTVDLDKIKRDAIEADYMFYTAMSQAKLALAGKGPKDAAAKMMLSFAKKHSQSYHFFDAAKLLGDLALALGDPQTALRYYGSLSKAPSPDTKIESRYLAGMVFLKSGESDKALEQFEPIIGLNAQTPATTRLQILSKAGKAVALSQKGESSEGLALVKTLITELSPTDIEMAARVYNAAGACYEASGDNDGAVFAYLHTHLMYSALPDAHAESLLRLIELWPKVGKPERAAEARQELQQRYPGAK